MAKRIVSAERIIKAPASKIFDLLADPANHQSFDGSGTLRGPKGSTASQRLSLGSKFSMNMENGVRYGITNVVCEFEENRKIAWKHIGGFIWRYEISEVDGGCKVVESFDYSVLLGLSLVPTSTPKNNQVNMEKTLERIAQIVE